MDRVPPAGVARRARAAPRARFARELPRASERDFLPPPDLVIYLRASVPTLIERIHSRGRNYERQISAEYLEQINRLYEEWISNFSLCPVLTVPADDLDYVAYPHHLDLVVGKVQEKLTGKEEVFF